MFIVYDLNKQDLIEYIAAYNNGVLIYEAYLDYDEKGNIIRTTNTKDIWYDYYHEDDYYERSSLFNRNRRY